MDIIGQFTSLFSNFGNLTWQMLVMWIVGGLLIYLAIAKKMEPSLLLPMGFGAILVNLPLSGAITQGDTEGPLSVLFQAGMSNELFPLLLFIGIGAMIDFGPLLEKPWLMLFGAAAQFGIFFTVCLAGIFFDLNDAVSIGREALPDHLVAVFTRVIGAIPIRICVHSEHGIGQHLLCVRSIRLRHLQGWLDVWPRESDRQPAIVAQVDGKGAVLGIRGSWVVRMLGRTGIVLVILEDRCHHVDEVAQARRTLSDIEAAIGI